MHHPVAWSEAGLPISTAFDDPFFTGGPAEVVQVFLGGNDLPARLRPGFHVAELGFGTGLNLLVLMQHADPSRAPLRFTSFEALPMAPADMARALRPYGLDGTEALVAAWAATEGPVRRMDLPGIAAEVVLGDARATLPRWQGRADAWFLDGFAPARNPGLWGEALLAQVAAHTAPGGSAATYTAAGHVRRALAAAGFTVERRPGHGHKRHMTVARLP
jgi:tRNA U34 5-methylaminomethyl-2-thiouridine-forming methyltransferase MnmC